MCRATECDERVSGYTIAGVRPITERSTLSANEGGIHDPVLDPYLHHDRSADPGGPFSCLNASFCLGSCPFSGPSPSPAVFNPSPRSTDAAGDSMRFFLPRAEKNRTLSSFSAKALTRPTGCGKWAFAAKEGGPKRSLGHANDPCWRSARKHAYSWIAKSLARARELEFDRRFGLSIPCPRRPSLSRFQPRHWPRYVSRPRRSFPARLWCRALRRWP